jgi:hypothetical protein
VNGDPTPVARKLGALVRRLASNHDGEVVAVVHAIVRTLKSAGSDLHALADKIERPTGIAEADMRRLFQAGYDAGLAACEEAHNGDGGFHTVAGSDPDWREVARYCYRKRTQLSEREAEFVESVSSQLVWRDPTEKQRKWLRSIFLRLGGRL